MVCVCMHACMCACVCAYVCVCVCCVCLLLLRRFFDSTHKTMVYLKFVQVVEPQLEAREKVTLSIGPARSCTLETI